MAKAKGPDKAPVPTTAQLPRSRLRLGLYAGGIAAAAAATWAVTAWVYETARNPEKNLAVVKDELSRARTRADQLRAQILQEHISQLTQAVLLREEHQIENARNGLVELGPRAIAPCRELALKTTADRLKRELIAVIGQFKERDAAFALTDIYLAQPDKHRVVKEAAAETLAKLGMREAAAGLGKIYREEDDAAMKKFLARYYKPYAAADPMGVADDKELRAELDRSQKQGALYRDIQSADPKTDAGFARLESVARSEEAQGLRLAALQRLATRRDAKAVLALKGLVQNPGRDEGGLLRANALHLLCRMEDADAVVAFVGFMEGQDPALRTAAVSVALASGKGEHLPPLMRIREGNYPETERKKAAEAIEKIQAHLKQRKTPSDR